jgi:hypothetical protein
VITFSISIFSVTVCGFASEIVGVGGEFEHPTDISNMEITNINDITLSTILRLIIILSPPI